MNKISFSFILCMLVFCTIEAQKIAVKNNLLYDATGTVNIGGEYAITKNLSANLSVNYNGWMISKPMAWKHTMVQPEVRYWLKEPFNEHYFGVHLVYLMFDIERLTLPMFGFERKYLYKDGTAYGGGLSYGYHLFLTPRLNLEFNLGIGFMNMKYKKHLHTAYPPAADAVIPFLTRSYIGPTQLGISVVYIIK